MKTNDPYPTFRAYKRCRRIARQCIRTGRGHIAFMRRGIVDSSVSSSACPGVDKLSDHAAIALNLELLSMDWTVLYVSNTMVKTIYVSSALPRGIRTTNPWFVEHNAPDYVTVYTDGSCYTPASPLRRMVISSRSIDREGLSEQLLAD